MAEKPDSSVGFSTGIKYWIAFMIGLQLLGYPIAISITFGLIGGIAGATIAAWLNAQDDGLPERPKQAPAEATVIQEETALQAEPRPRFQKYGMTGLRPRGYQRRAIRRFGWLFRK